MNILYDLFPNLERLGGEFLRSVEQTATMIGVSGTIAWILGIAVGVLLVTTRPGGILEHRDRKSVV